MPYSPIPSGYGISYRPWGREVFVLHPIPFNLIAGLIHKVSLSLRFLKHGTKSNKIDVAYRLGYEAGLRKNPKKKGVK